MRRLLIIGVVLALMLAACGGDDSGSDGSSSGDSGNGTGDELDIEVLGFDRDFSSSDLPDGFPSELEPPSYIAGQVAEIGGTTSVSYYSELSFGEALSRYEELVGASPIVTGDPGQRIAVWTQTTDWAVGLFEEEPLLMTFTEVPG